MEVSYQGGTKGAYQVGNEGTYQGGMKGDLSGGEGKLSWEMKRANILVKRK